MLFEIQNRDNPTLRITSSEPSVINGETIGTLEFYGNDYSNEGPEVRSYISAIETTDTGGSPGRDYSLAFGTHYVNKTYERMRIHPNGNIGIGTENPRHKLEISGPEGGNYLDIRNNHAASDGVSKDTILGQIGFSGTDLSTSGMTVAAIRGVGGAPWTSTPSTRKGYLAFFTQGDSDIGMVERLRIDSVGRVGIGTDTPNQSLQVVGYIEASSGYRAGGTTAILRSGSTNYFGSNYGDDIVLRTGSGRDTVHIESQDGEALRIKSTGNVGIATNTADQKLEVLDTTNPQLRLTQTDSTVYTDFQTDATGNLQITPTSGFAYVNGSLVTTSDATKKKNITDLTYGLEDIMKLRAVSYDWKNNGQTNIGFIAQEVEDIIPEVVHGIEGENLGISYSHLTALAIKAIQQQQIQIDGLKLAVNKNNQELNDITEITEKLGLENEDQNLQISGLNNENKKLVNELDKVTKELQDKDQKIEQLETEITEKAEFGDDNAGKSEIVKGQKEVEILTEAVQEDSKIIISPAGSTFGEVLYYDEIKNQKSFKIKINKEVEADIKFDWVII